MTALPKTIGGTADKLYRLRSQRLELQKKVAALQSQESALKDHGIHQLTRQKITSGRGKLATFSIKPAVVASVEDWESFYEYIREHDAFELLQRRVNDKSWNERVDIEGKCPPGTRPETILKVSLTKAGGS